MQLLVPSAVSNSVLRHQELLGRRNFPWNNRVRPGGRRRLVSSFRLLETSILKEFLRMVILRGRSISFQVSDRLDILTQAELSAGERRQTEPSGRLVLC